MGHTSLDEMIEELEQNLAYTKSCMPSTANSESTGQMEKHLADLKAIADRNRELQVPRFRVPNARCCYFCLEEKPRLHDRKIRIETYDGAILGGVVLKLQTYSYRVCSGCQIKLLMRGAVILLCSALFGVGIGLLLAVLTGLDPKGVNVAVKFICCTFYLVAFFSCFHSYGRKRLNVLRFFVAGLFLLTSLPLILYLHSLTIAASICAVMALSLPMILFNFRKELNLFSRLHGRVVY